MCSLNQPEALFSFISRDAAAWRGYERLVKTTTTTRECGACARAVSRLFEISPLSLFEVNRVVTLDYAWPTTWPIGRLGKCFNDGGRMCARVVDCRRRRSSFPEERPATR